MNDQKKTDKKQKYIKLGTYLLEFLAFLLLLYLIVLPFYPRFNYGLKKGSEAVSRAKDIEYIKAVSNSYSAAFPEADYSISPNRVIIPKIGVNAPIVETANAEYGLSLGAWHVPESSTPERGGNTVITGHRFKYLPPNNLTFYLFHELEEGDLFTVIWAGKNYYYKIRETRIVDDTEMSILENTKEPIVTMFTCHPIYSTEKRLVVVGDLLEIEGDDSKG